MKILSPFEYRKMPWKNGAGTTTEIAIEPPGSELEAQSYLWRVSIADVTASGAFSLFPGYDRTILLLEGSGMVLESAEDGSIDLSQRLRPHTFPGERQVTGRLLSSPVRDFNLMIRRRRATSHLEVLKLTKARRIPCPPGTTLIAYVVQGGLIAAPAGCTLIADHSLDLEPTALSTVVSIAITEIARSRGVQ